MNLKEAFRYHNFLEKMISDITYLMRKQEYCMNTLKTHFKSKANPEAEDVVEEEYVERIATFAQLCNAAWRLVEHKKNLTIAINETKAMIAEGSKNNPEVGILDYDALIDYNKHSRGVINAMQTAFRYTPSVNTIQGSDYKFNVEGNQMPYRYDIEVQTTDLFDRKELKKAIEIAMYNADMMSTKIDEMLVNVHVNYDPFINVNASIEDVVAALNPDKEETPVNE